MRLLGVLVALFSAAEAANILAIFPFPGRSQYIVVEPLLKALAARGHNLTVISGYPQKQAVPNFRDIAVLDMVKASEGKWKFFVVD